MQIRKINPENDWHLSSWKSHSIKQQPKWPNRDKYKAVIHNISKMPQLVSAGEIMQLKQRLREVERGESFILQGGDCADI